MQKLRDLRQISEKGGRIGGLEDWRIGGLEDWGIGGLEDWRIGGLMFRIFLNKN
jgi:hypothetical protein